jgi:cell division septation protein DedD
VTFAVQFGNFTDQARANAMLSALQSDGIAARIVVETDVNNQRWYAVRTPPFVDQAAAELAAVRYRDRQGLSSLVMAQPGGGGNGS